MVYYINSHFVYKNSLILLERTENRGKDKRAEPFPAQGPSKNSYKRVLNKISSQFKKIKQFKDIAEKHASEFEKVT